MGKISTYGFDSTVSTTDFVIGTDAQDSNNTRNYLIGDILALVPDVEWGDIVGTLSDQTDLQNALNAKQDTLVSGTNIKTINSTTLLGSGNLAVQEVLVSGTNIKTINGSSILGSGNLSIPSESYVYQVGSVCINNQIPSAQDSALQVSLGPAVSNVNVDVQVGGTVTFLTAGKYIVKLFINAGREGSISGASVVAWRTMFNSSQYGELRSFILESTDSYKQEEVDFFIDASVGDRFAVQIMDDSVGVDDNSGLYQTPITWGEVPPSSVQIWKQE